MKEEIKEEIKDKCHYHQNRINLGDIGTIMTVIALICTVVYQTAQTTTKLDMEFRNVNVRIDKGFNNFEKKLNNEIDDIEKSMTKGFKILQDKFDAELKHNKELINKENQNIEKEISDVRGIYSDRMSKFEGRLNDFNNQLNSSKDLIIKFVAEEYGHLMSKKWITETKEKELIQKIEKYNEDIKKYDERNREKIEKLLFDINEIKKD